MNKAIVKDQVEINAPVEKVWNILTQTKYYKQWDDLPEGFSGDKLKKGDVIEWQGYSKMTVTECKENEQLKLSLILPKVDLNPNEYDVAYAYHVAEKDGKTLLNFEIGDFSPLPDPKQYVDASEEFVNSAKKKIKELAETE